MIVLILTVAICSIVLLRQVGQFPTREEYARRRLNRDVRKYQQAFLKLRQEK